MKSWKERNPTQFEETDPKAGPVRPASSSEENHTDLSLGVWGVAQRAPLDSEPQPLRSPSWESLEAVPNSTFSGPSV